MSREGGGLKEMRRYVHLGPTVHLTWLSEKNLRAMEMLDSLWAYVVRLHVRPLGFMGRGRARGAYHELGVPLVGGEALTDEDLGQLDEDEAVIEVGEHARDLKAALPQDEVDPVREDLLWSPRLVGWLVG
jgi:hypothetical protein